MNSIIRITESISDWVASISAVTLGLMTTLIADEYCAYGLAAIIFLGAGYCLKEKGHIRITLVLGFLPEKVSQIITSKPKIPAKTHVSCP